MKSSLSPSTKKNTFNYKTGLTMQKKSKLSKYIELFRKKIEVYLAPNISIKATIYPVEKEGAVIELIFNPKGENDDVFARTYTTVGSVLASIPQRLVSGNIENVSFGGTNIYMEANRVLLIKGEDQPKHWDGNAVIEDVRRVVSTSQGGASDISK